MNIEVNLHQDNNIVALIDGRVAFIARSGVLTMPALRCLESMKARLLSDPRPKGFLAVMPGTAGISKEEIVERQRQFIRQVSAEVKDLSFAIVILGDSVQATAMRVVGRIFVLGRQNMATFSDLGAGAGWLAERTGMDASTFRGIAADLVDRVSGATEAETRLRD
jgi:hypothetical protein